MAKQKLTEETSIIIDPREYYGQDVEVEIICTMLASAYGMTKLSTICENCVGLFSTTVGQPIVQSLIRIYKENGRTYADSENKKAFFRVFEKKLCEIVKNEDDRDTIYAALEEFVAKVDDDEFHYSNPDDIELLYSTLPHYFQFLNNKRLVSDMVTISGTEYTPVDYNQAVDKALEQHQVISVDESRLISPNTSDGSNSWRHEGKNRTVFTLPTSMGAFAQVLNPLLYRSAFISILAPEKTGKTWMLQELAMRACRRGANVLFFAAGDMTAEEMSERMAIRKAETNSNPDYCGELYVPVLDCLRNQNGTCTLGRRTGSVALEKAKAETKGKYDTKFSKSEEKQQKQKIMPEELVRQNPDYTPCSECFRCDSKAWIPAYWWEKQNPVTSLLEMSDLEYDTLMQEKNEQWGKGDFGILDFPANTLTMSRIKNIIRQYKREGKKIDMVVADYMDILAKEKHYSRDFRQSQNELWLDGRSLAMSEDVLFLVATQSNRVLPDVKYLTQANISEDIRKGAHVTAMIGMMRTPEDKRLGLAKMNIIAGRNISYSEDNVFTILQCLEQGNPFITSYLPKQFSE